MTSIELTDHLKHTATLDKGAFIGSLCFYTIEATTVPYATAKAQMEAAGLGSAVPRSAPCDADVFRRAFSNGRRRRTQTTSTTVENLLVSDVANRWVTLGTRGRALEEIVKRIVVEEVDQEGELLSYSEAVEIRYNVNHPDALSIKVINEPLPVSAHAEVLADLRAVLEGTAPAASGVASALAATSASASGTARAMTLARELEAVYLRERGCLDSNGIRLMVKTALSECHATLVREGGGVYFVSSKYDPQLDALVKIADVIPGATVHTVPLIDDRRQRDLVKKAYEAEVTTEVDKLIVDALEVLKGDDGISPRKFSALQTKMLAVKSKVSEYDELLQEQIDSSRFRLDILTHHMRELFNKVA